MSPTHRTISRLTIAAIGLIALLPLLSIVVPFPRTKVEGVTNTYPWPAWSAKSVRKGGYQRRAEQWAAKAHPFWGWSVRTVNELVHRGAGEVSLDYGTSIQGGNEGYLWQPMYLRAFNRTKKPPTKIIHATFRSLNRVQRFFASKGIPLVAVINPNVLFLYPELLPEKYKAVRKNKSSYEVSLASIAKEGPKVIDTFAFLNRLKEGSSVRFFEPTGSHWNDVGSCLAAREVGRELAGAWGEEPPILRCEEFKVEFPPREPELDLVHIANLLNEERLYRPAPYLTSIEKARFKKPRKILLIGTSFLFGLERQLLKHGIADSTTLLFYFKRLRRDGRGGFNTLRFEKLTPEALLSYDAIILDVNVAGPGMLGYGFLPFATKAFHLLER